MLYSPICPRCNVTTSMHYCRVLYQLYMHTCQRELPSSGAVNECLWLVGEWPASNVRRNINAQLGARFYGPKTNIRTTIYHSRCRWHQKIFRQAPAVASNWWHGGGALLPPRRRTWRKEKHTLHNNQTNRRVQRATTIFCKDVGDIINLWMTKMLKMMLTSDSDFSRTKWSGKE